jgi:hypothetical protein
MGIYIKTFENFEYSESYFQDIFVNKLTAMFPNGVKLYHRTEPKYLENIMKEGLSPNYGRIIPVIHTVLGDPGIQRVGGDTVLLEITITPDSYYDLYPEENTYWNSDLMEDEETGETDWDMLFDIYMDAHPDLVGGDITLDETVPPENIKVIG